jgi:hypothetical protein
MKRIALPAACLSILLVAMLLIAVATTPARAQSAVACGCYCGITISPPCSEQACKNACGWRGGDGGRQSGPARLWYCRALAPNGAYGWASSSNQDGARQRALNECRQRASGCVIEACRINDPGLASAPPKTRSTAQGQRQTKAEQGWCELCVRKLRSDINSGWASALIRSYVGQAIAGYENCKRRAGGTCAAGDQLVNRLRACRSEAFAGYRACVSSTLH